MEIPPGDPGHGHFHIGIRDDAPLKTGADPLQITAVQHHVGLVFLRPHFQLLLVLGHQHGIGQPGHPHQLVKVFRRDAGQPAVLGEGIGIPVGLPRHRDALAPGLHRRDVGALPFVEGQLFRLAVRIVFRPETAHPATFIDIHLLDAIVDLVQKLGVAFPHNDIEGFLGELRHDPFVVAFPDGGRDDGIHVAVLQRFRHLLFVSIALCPVDEALLRRKLCQILIPGVPQHLADGLGVQREIIPFLKTVVVGTDADLCACGSDGFREIEVL